ncbi:hypothetical protein POL68_03590 [Stigmatella sp. ncwal1]|uniref:Outer membrane protein beta-barrel domain-containing protein n=1 Tax=Stigmatella ashevillensis TaxID=2995309 RepID=A0ABT5D1K6_9BACT|nr:hypothetical protein [Stigmatella ashevillena]MDC0707543.1 hypothetical protein [Stigmatella ashevillena]
MWSLCWLGLALLLVFPGPASAQRRRRSLNNDPDPICEKNRGGPCTKWRIAALGSGVVSTKDLSAEVGVKAGVSWVVGPGMELGAGMLMLSDGHWDEWDEGSHLGLIEGVFRIAPVTGRNARIFLEFSLGFAAREEPDVSLFSFPAGGVATSLEISVPNVGFFVTAGLSLLRIERMTALPHVGAGVVF